MGKRKHKIIALISITAIVVTLLFVSLTYGFWAGSIASTKRLLRPSVVIGNWEALEGQLDFDDWVEMLKSQDPFLYNYRNQIHILGDSDALPVPLTIATVSKHDVILYKQNGEVGFVKAATDLPPTIFSSWQNFFLAIADLQQGISTTSQDFTLGNVYTTASEPIWYNGNAYRVRRDGVVSSPHIGEDWFLVSDDFVFQDYPVGSFVRYNDSHYRKLTSAFAIPGTNDSIWQPLVEIQREVFEIPLWNQEAYQLHSVVRYYNGQFFVSLADNNTTNPLQSSLWHHIQEFSPSLAVREFVEGQSYQAGAFVFSDRGSGIEYFYHLGNPHWTTPLDGAAWRRVENWDELTAVSSWSSTFSYTQMGVLVEYNGEIFRRFGASAPVGISPNLVPQAWERILRWQETQQPLPFVAGSWSGNRIFVFEENYYALVSGSTWPTYENTPATSPRFRQIVEWSSETQYSVLGNLSWGTGTSHAYTIHPRTGEKIFWELYNSPTGATGTVNGLTEDGNPNDFWQDDTHSPYWRRHRFEALDRLVVTTVANNPVVWERVGTAPTSQRPSILNNDWQRRVYPVNAEYVFTKQDGGIFLWESTLAGNNTHIPGSSQGTGWRRIIYQGTQEFSYTVNDGKMYSFWHSPSQSSAFPAALVADYIRLSYGVVQNLPEYFYMYSEDGLASYFNNSLSAIRHLQSAWTGASEEMRYNFSPHATYAVGDIVAFGSTLTNTTRYFRMQAGVNPNQAAGISPFSPAGNAFWEEVR